MEFVREIFTETGPPAASERAAAATDDGLLGAICQGRGQKPDAKDRPATFIDRNGRSNSCSQPLGDWRNSLATAIRDPDELLDRLGLPAEFREPARRAAELFPMVVPHSYAQRMRHGDPNDPLLRQVLPLAEEFEDRVGFDSDPVDDAAARIAPGLLHKYQGRALLIATGTCAIHCRYCFRRHYPYIEEPKQTADWQPAFDAIRADDSIHEIILSGGDPLILADGRLKALLHELAAIPHVSRIRVHSRLPIVLPNRVTASLIDLLRETRLQPVMVVHANHAQEIQNDCREALLRLVRGGIPTLNQAVLLRGVNDSTDALVGLSEALIDLGVMPYYLHQLDRVRGATHFEVDEAHGRQLIDELRVRLPGYAVPKYVREIPGRESKTPLEVNMA